MRYFSAICLSLAASLGLSTGVKAQGDSDPGLSSIGAMRPASALLIDEETYENNKTHLGFAHTLAKGERDVALNISHVELRAAITDIGYIDVKLPYYAVRGNLAKLSGLSDLSVAYTHFMPDIDGITWQFTGGLRIGMGNATQTDGKGRPLPMVYQSSQGTTDIILGAAMTYKQYVSAALGYQQPVIRYNENDYTRVTPSNELAYSNADFPLSRKLYRNGDLMLRVEGHLTGKRAGISAGPLAFYHLRNDLFLDVDQKYREIDGSQGFALNIAGSAYYRFGRYGSWKLDVSGAFPVAQRDVYPDGTRREWTIMPRLTYFFNQDILLF